LTISVYEQQHSGDCVLPDGRIRKHVLPVRMCWLPRNICMSKSSSRINTGHLNLMIQVHVSVYATQIRWRVDFFLYVIWGSNGRKKINKSRYFDEFARFQHPWIWKRYFGIVVIKSVCMYCIYALLAPRRFVLN
jgi:hypothetical protein